MIGQQRRQVPRMVWMLGPSGIEVAAGIGKAVPLTACSIVDVKGKESRFRPGKTCHLRFNNHTIFPLEKSHHSAHRWMAAVPANLGDSNGINISLQTITPDSSYAADSSVESIEKHKCLFRPSRPALIFILLRMPSQKCKSAAAAPRLPSAAAPQSTQS